MREAAINLAYLASAILFILTFKGLAHPRTAVRGNSLGAIGMLVAVVATLIHQRVLSYELIAIGAAIGATIGLLLAVKVKMTQMPQMVALLNGFGGGASVLVAAAALYEAESAGGEMGLQFTIATVATGFIGAVTFSGSLVAFDKLQELLSSGKPVRFPGQHYVNILLALGCVAMGAWIVMGATDLTPYWVLVGLSLLLGILFVIPIGGADMPVAVCLLNSYSGMAGAATGFVLNNNALIIAGSLVGTSGILLTRIMCKAMNRSLLNVLVGGVGGDVAPKGKHDDVYAGKVKAASADELAMLFDGARRVVVVPGYGLAVSQGQFAIRDLANLLESKGVEVTFAIHPVAGRMPGHMNILLAEADIPYERLQTMEEANPGFEQTDVTIVVGANDVVNPLARTDPQSPIAGMPILDVDKSRTVIVIKRSLSPGFAGIPNPLFAADNTLMFFGDGKKAILELVAAIKEA